MAKNTLISRIKSNATGRNASAANTLALVAEAIEHMDGASGDWTPLAWIVALAEGADKGRLRAIIQAACGVTFKSDKKSAMGLRAKPAAADAVDRRDLLGAYVLRKVSFRSKILSEGVDNLEPLLAKEEKDYSLSAAAAAFVRKAVREGHSEAAAVAAVQAVAREIEAERLADAA